MVEFLNENDFSNIECLSNIIYLDDIVDAKTVNAWIFEVISRSKFGSVCEVHDLIEFLTAYWCFLFEHNRKSANIYLINIFQ